MGAMAATGSAVVGACPSVAEPFDEVDGLLLRVRRPGGRLDAGAARALAAVADLGTGVVELTSRANVQLRGLQRRDLGQAHDLLTAAALVGRSGAPELAVDLVAAPTAGFDAGELLDVTPLVDELVDVLRHVPDHRQPAPKFGVLVDGGGFVHVRDRRHDVGLGAVALPSGEVALEAVLDRSLPLVASSADDVVLVAPGDAAALVGALVAQCAGGRRVADLVATRAAIDVLAAAAATAGVALRHAPRGDVLHPTVPSRSPVGDVAGDAIGLAASLGRLDPAQLRVIADVAERHGRGELRVTPWRGVLVPDVAPAARPAALAALGHAGLVVDPGDAALAVIACAGSSGCAAGLADTQRDGRRVIELLRGLPAHRRPASVHLAGCGKRCASRRPSALTLEAGPAPGRYQVELADGTRVGDIGGDDLDAAVARWGGRA